MDAELWVRKFFRSHEQIFLWGASVSIWVVRDWKFWWVKVGVKVSSRILVLVGEKGRWH
jgi:hypothetical protein